MPGLDMSGMVYPEWDTKDILAHIVAWHESFARNVELLAHGEPAQPPRGTLQHVNHEGVAANRNHSVSQLLRRLRKAQRTIEANIEDKTITTIPYRQPGTSYTPTEHLDIVAGHIADHYRDVLKAHIKPSIDATGNIAATTQLQL